MEKSMMDELLQVRSKSLLETFTRCASEHMMLCWVHAHDGETLQAEVVLDPLMLADVAMVLGPEKADEWADEVREIWHNATIHAAALYMEAMEGTE